MGAGSESRSSDGHSSQTCTFAPERSKQRSHGRRREESRPSPPPILQWLASEERLDSKSLVESRIVEFQLVESRNLWNHRDYVWGGNRPAVGPNW